EDQPRVGALDSSRTEHSDIYDFDQPTPTGGVPVVEPAPPAEPAPTTRIRTRVGKDKETPTRSSGPGGGRSGEADTLVRILTGIGLLYGAVLTTVAYDVGSFIAGRAIGSHPLMPEVSPNKTWEGALGGLTGSVAIAVLLVQAIHPWNIKHAALLGLIVAVVAP